MSSRASVRGRPGGHQHRHVRWFIENVQIDGFAPDFSRFLFLNLVVQPSLGFMNRGQKGPTPPQMSFLLSNILTLHNWESKHVLWDKGSWEVPWVAWHWPVLLSGRTAPLPCDSLTQAHPPESSQPFLLNIPVSFVQLLCKVSIDGEAEAISQLIK